MLDYGNHGNHNFHIHSHSIKNIRILIFFRILFLKLCVVQSSAFNKQRRFTESVPAQSEIVLRLFGQIEPPAEAGDILCVVIQTLIVKASIKNIFPETRHYQPEIPLNQDMTKYFHHRIYQI